MTSENAKAPALGGASGAIENRKTSPYQEEETTMNTIIADTTDTSNLEPFDTMHVVDARHAGGALYLTDEHVEWMCRTLIRVEIPGVVLHLAPHEARDLATALQSLATFIDEEPAEIRRHTEPGAPTFEEGI